MIILQNLEQKFVSEKMKTNRELQKNKEIKDFVVIRNKKLQHLWNLKNKILEIYTRLIFSNYFS